MFYLGKKTKKISRVLLEKKIFIKYKKRKFIFLVTRFVKKIKKNKENTDQIIISLRFS